MSPRRSLHIDGRWVSGGGAEMASASPATGRETWSGAGATDRQVNEAVDAARAARGAWARKSLDDRAGVLRTFADRLESEAERIARTISDETGKPLWESCQEAAAMRAKIDITISAYDERRGREQIDSPGAVAITRFRPHGVLAVLGPFNLPGHLPNGHIVPALLAGNAVVFKPSELAPATGELAVGLWSEAGLPAGVLNLVQGGAETGRALVGCAGIDGVLFTGSFAAGRAINRALADEPGRIVALEMGGNNPLIVHGVADLDGAAYLTILSAYITAGQRCTCARRLIVPDGRDGDRFVDRLAARIGGIRVGAADDEPEPFMGPVISAAAADRLLEAQRGLIERGGAPVVEMAPVGGGGAMLSPGLIDVSAVGDRDDEELFGPLLQLIRVPDFDAAIAEADRTAYGLAAALFCDDRELWERFRATVRAGVVNWNRQSTGASGRLPFGGVGRSGNHRPVGYHAVDCCAYPVASLECDAVALPEQRLPGTGD